VCRRCAVAVACVQAMHRDIKTNSMQHTEAYLRRRCVRLLLWKAKVAAEAQAALDAEAEAEAEADDDEAEDDDE